MSHSPQTGTSAPHAAAHGEAGFARTYIFSTDHKTIAKQYLAWGLFWTVVGSFLAGVMRWQLAWPGSDVPGWGTVGPGAYNVLVTLHGTIMVFFVAMPILLGAFGNFLIPLMVGARDMAFPRLNMLSILVFGVASVVLLVSFFVPGGAASAGWTGYPPLSGKVEYTGSNWGLTLWLLAHALEFAAFLMGGVNFLTTALTLRAPGMTLLRMPLAVWHQLAATLIFLLSVGPLIAGAVMLLLDRLIGTRFYVPGDGGDPLLWQHLFWFFGHPEVYVLLLPPVGFVCEVLPVFSRKPIFGYRWILWATGGVVGLSFIVWAHHMFVSGMNPGLAMPFSITTILISVPVAFVLFALIATLWRGSISFETPMLFALGFIAMFVFGGLTGIFNGSAPVDIYLRGTYFVVAHFHYTLFSATVFGAFAGFYYWFPKMFGRMLSEPLGRLHFWLTAVFFNLTFFLLHNIGLAGMARRTADPRAFEMLRPHQWINEWATVASFLLLAAQIPFVVNVVRSLVAGAPAPVNPWQASTLEWSVASPPPHLNWGAELPVVQRGPYEYSVPGESQDWLPQRQPLAAGS
ncbi:MAG TPA: cbb3-type cytochrome c oxidase subunit I [Methylomirabilota bacterium]|nr:cbb3-type cytochrome c oxidase subunit I [Methylomirabilota bacterium]